MAPETKIYLIRHGAVENPNDIVYGRMPGFPLSSQGKEQVKKLAEVLRSKGVKFEAIYSSPLERAVQTAQIIKREFGLANIKINEALIDTAVPGIEGKPMDVVRAVQFDNFRPEIKVAGSETPQDVIDRMSRFLKFVKQNHQEETVAVVTHGDPSRFALWWLQHPEGGLPKKLRDDDYLGKAEAVVLNFGEGDQFLGYEHIRQENSNPLAEERSIN